MFRDTHTMIRSLVLLYLSFFDDHKMGDEMDAPRQPLHDLSKL